MRTKFLAILLTLCMLVGLMPVAVMAEETVIKVEDETSLNTAITNSDGTDEEPMVITLTGNIELTNELAIPDGKHIILDGSGYSVYPGSEFTYPAGLNMIVVGTESASEDVTTSLEVRNLTLDAKFSERSDKSEIIEAIKESRLSEYQNANNNRLRVVGIYKNATFIADSGSVITGGYSGTSTCGGIRVYSDGTLVINDDAIIKGNYAKPCGAVLIADNTATVIMNGGKITDNHSTFDGAAIQMWGGTFKMNGGIISDNVSYQDSGAAISANKSGDSYTYNITINDGTFKDNRAKNHGGAIALNKNATTNLTINGGKFIGNVADTHAGAIYIANEKVTANIKDTEFRDNNAGQRGGAIVVGNGNVTIKNALFDKNKVTAVEGSYMLGGAVYCGGGNISMEDCIFTENFAPEGGAVAGYNGGAVVSIENGTFKNNTAANNGGALVLIHGQTISLNGSTLEGNDGDNSAIYIADDCNLKIEGNLVLGENDKINMREDSVYPAKIVLTGELGETANINIGVSPAEPIESDGEYTIKESDAEKFNSLNENFVFMYNNGSVKKVDTVTVTFNSNNGNNETSTQKVPKNYAEYLNENGFKYEKHNFNCWNTVAGGTGNSYTDGEQVNFDTDTTLYAQWNPYQLIGIEIAKKPNTTSYKVGQSFDTEGMVVNAVYDNGEEVEVFDYTYDPKGALSLDYDKITVTYEGMTAEIDITVKKKSNTSDKSSSSFSLPSSKDKDKKEPEKEPVKEEPEQNEAEEMILLTVGAKEADVFGNEVVNDVALIIVNDRTMLPIRFVAEALGGEVDWDQALRKVTITKDTTVIEIFIGESNAIVNNNLIYLDSPAFIENGRTYLPLRFVAESLNADVNWIEDRKTIIIVPNK